MRESILRHSALSRLLCIALYAGDTSDCEVEAAELLKILRALLSAAIESKFAVNGIPLLTKRQKEARDAGARGEAEAALVKENKIAINKRRLHAAQARKLKLREAAAQKRAVIAAKMQRALSTKRPSKIVQDHAFES